MVWWKTRCPRPLDDASKVEPWRRRRDSNPRILELRVGSVRSDESVGRASLFLRLRGLRPRRVGVRARESVLEPTSGFEPERPGYKAGCATIAHRGRENCAHPSEAAIVFFKTSAFTN
jgi:hypothetical protein